MRAKFRSKNHPFQVAKRQRENLFGDDVDITDEANDRETPTELFSQLDAEFRFTLDVAASHENTKCQRYFTKGDDGLAHSWLGEVVWCNPPFSEIESWVRKAWSEFNDARHIHLNGLNDVVIVMLLPANRTDQPWWQNLVEPERDCGHWFKTEFLPGRPRFVMPGDEGIRPNSRPPFGLVLCIWR